MTDDRKDLLGRVQHYLETPGDLTPDEMSWLLQDVQNAAAARRDVQISPTVVPPIVHLNGTGRAMLLTQRRELWDALSAVEDKLKQAAPNARDFYPEPGRWEKALAAHTRRLTILGDLLADVEIELSTIEE